MLFRSPRTVNGAVLHEVRNLQQVTGLSVDRTNEILHECGSVILLLSIVSEADIAKLTKAFENARPMSPTEMLQAALTESYGRARVELSDEVRQLIRELTAQAEIPVPADIRATLRPYLLPLHPRNKCGISVKES